jgi:hypothetical protein
MLRTAAREPSLERPFRETAPSARKLPGDTLGDEWRSAESLQRGQRCPLIADLS